MDDVAEVQRQLQQLREAGRIRDDALRYLAETEEMQGQRWERLSQVVDDAAWQYISMRVDSVEERLRDQGAPLWLSGIIIVGVTLIPVSALTGTFLLALTKSSQKLLKRAVGRRLERAVRTYQIASPAARSDAFRNAMDVAKEFKQTEEVAGRFAQYLKDSLQPELTATLRNSALELAKTLGEQPFKQASGRKMTKPDAPVVVVRRSLYGSINAFVHAEGSARKILKDKIRDLYDIATSPKPAKEAKAKEAEAQKEASKSAHRAFAHFARAFREEPLPKTNKAALDQLTELRTQLAPDAAESSRTPDVKDLRELQLLIEATIWATTYDFTPRRREESVNAAVEKRVGQNMFMVKPDDKLRPAPLPDALWKRLIERYIDPDERKSYKDVGKLDRLGTKSHPYSSEPGKKTWSPEVRLSHYFSQVLYPQINKENSEMVRRFSTL